MQTAIESSTPPTTQPVDPYGGYEGLGYFAPVGPPFSPPRPPNIAGQDITDRLSQIRDAIRTEWKWAGLRHLRMDPTAPTKQSAIEIRGKQNWDIYQLAFQKSLFGGSGDYVGTVTLRIGGVARVFRAEEVNYYLYGLAYRLLWEAHRLPDIRSGQTRMRRVSSGSKIVTVPPPYLVYPTAAQAVSMMESDIEFYRWTWGLFYQLERPAASGRIAWAEAGFYNDLSRALPSAIDTAKPNLVKYQGQLGAYIGNVESHIGDEEDVYISVGLTSGPKDP